jgi:predicted MFS family arabinose efflux permease
MIAMDLLRFTILLSLPVAYAFGRLTFVHLVVVSVIVAAANIGFNAAAGSCLRSLVRTEDLVTATGRFESTTWTATALGPPLGGAAIGIFGPLTTVLANAVSYLLSALAIHRIGGREPQPPARSSARLRPGDILDGWRYILAEPRLRPLFLNTVLVNALIMATAPLLAVLLLDDLGFAPWQYGLAFGGPCIGGLIGSRLARRLVTRFSPQPVLLVSGTLRACWSLGLVFVRSGPEGLALIMAIEFGLITCMGVFNPVFAAYRLEHTAPERTARTLTAWSITSSAVIAVTTVLGGILAAGTSPRFAIGLAGALLLATPVLLLRRR